MCLLCACDTQHNVCCVYSQRAMEFQKPQMNETIFNYAFVELHLEIIRKCCGESINR